jgi:nucleoside 2-deoxyribosyltransferase
MKIYLAGPMFQTEDNECKAWRDEAIAKLTGHEIFNPMIRDYRGRTDEKAAEIVEEDKKDIDSCDVILVNHTRPSVGTSMEILYAWERKKRIITVIHSDQISPWLLYHSERIFRDLDSAIDYLNNHSPAE